MVKKQKYPGISFDKKLKRWIAKLAKNGTVHVATTDSFKAAKKEMKRFELI